jgi:hypothetical protein
MRWLPARVSGRSDTAVARPSLARGERILAMESDTAGGRVVATNAALYHLPSSASGADWQRLEWADTGRLSWDSRQGLLSLVGLGPDGPYRLALALARRSAIAALCTERVGATRLASRRVALADGTTVVVQARRRPCSAGVTWVVLLDGAAELPEGDAQERVAAAIRQMRRELCL